MRAFAELLERLVYTPQRNGKIRLLTEYFGTTPDPDRGLAVAAVTRDLEIASAKPAMLRELIAERLDPVLFEYSYDYVGDLAETISLAWPSKPGANRTPALHEVVEALNEADKTAARKLIEGWLDGMDASERWALLKLITGGLRIGVSARLAKTALAAYGDVNVSEIEEIWHGLDSPYANLFAWLEGVGEKPSSNKPGLFRPVMLAHPVDEETPPDFSPDTHAAEWKWDGVRVQAVSENGVRRLYSRTGDDIAAAFPDILAAMDFDAVIDGELLIFHPERQTDGETFPVRPFSDLQKRLNRKTVSKKLLASNPAFIRAYDLLSHDGEDLRAEPFADRRLRLEALFASRKFDRFDLSPLVAFETAGDLATLRAAPPDDAIEGVMIKRLAAPYVPGRPTGEWWKWKRDPFLVDAVLMYAQRGHGKRSSFYSDFTFGVWTDDGGLAPVGKAYFGFSDEELKELDRFVRNHTKDRFGPVRQVQADREVGLVLEIAFEGLNRSPRHKSGVAMRFPRIHRIRWDKPSAEADTLATLKDMLPSDGGVS
ncbi:MAG: cisplatin damage response ATP-dependent DNA ligase [Pseudomonadota bacterium]